MGAGSKPASISFVAGCRSGCRSRCGAAIRLFRPDLYECTNSNRLPRGTGPWSDPGKTLQSTIRTREQSRWLLRFRLGRARAHRPQEPGKSRGVRRMPWVVSWVARSEKSVLPLRLHSEAKAARASAQNASVQDGTVVFWKRRRSAPGWCTNRDDTCQSALEWREAPGEQISRLASAERDSLPDPAFTACVAVNRKHACQLRRKSFRLSRLLTGIRAWPDGPGRRTGRLR